MKRDAVMPMILLVCCCLFEVESVTRSTVTTATSISAASVSAASVSAASVSITSISATSISATRSRARIRNFKYKASSYIIIVILGADLNKVATTACGLVNGPAKVELIIVTVHIVPAANSLNKTIYRKKKVR
jgi:hypothetical protein